MTSESLASARALLAELKATQAYLRATAARALPYPALLSVERRAQKRCAELLTALGVELGASPPATEPVVISLAGGGEPPAAPVRTSPTGAVRTPVRTRTLITAQSPVHDEDEDDSDAATVAGSTLRARHRAQRQAEAQRDGPPNSLGATPPLPSREATEGAPPDGPAASEEDALVSFDPLSQHSESVGYVAYAQDGTPEESPPRQVLEEAEPIESPAASEDVPLGPFEEADREPAQNRPTSAWVQGPAGPTSRVALSGEKRGSESALAGSVERVESPSPASKRSTSGLYGGAAVPTIRSSGGDSPRPRAAAIQLNASGLGGRMLGIEEEDEPIEVGAAEDGFDPGTESFKISLQEEEDEGDELSEEGMLPEELEEPPPEPTEAERTASPDEVDAIFAQAVAMASTGNLQGAADLFSDVIDADPTRMAAHVARGRLHLDLGDYSRAMSDFTVASEIAAESPEPQVAIGDLYFARKDYRKAIDYFNAALTMEPNHGMAYCRRGISHYYRKNYHDALKDLLRAEEIQPEIPNIMTYISMAKKKARQR